MKRIFKSQNTKSKEKDISRVLSWLSSLSVAVDRDNGERVTQEDLKAQLKIVGQDLKAIKEQVLPPLTKALRNSHDNGNKMAKQVDVLTTKLNNAVRESDPKTLRFLEQTFSNTSTASTPELKRTMAAWGIDPPSYHTAVNPTAPPANLYPNLEAMNLSASLPIAKTTYSIKKNGKIESIDKGSYPIQHGPENDSEAEEGTMEAAVSPAPVSSRTRSRPTRELSQDQLDTIDVKQPDQIKGVVLVTRSIY